MKAKILKQLGLRRSISSIETSYAIEENRRREKAKKEHQHYKQEIRKFKTSHVHNLERKLKLTEKYCNKFGQ